MNDLFIQTLPSKTLQLARLFQKEKPEFLDSFYLSGGTALSLHLGHRESEDLDFFSKESFSPLEIENQLVKFGSLAGTEFAKGTLNTFLNEVNLQFLKYAYELLEEMVDWNGVKVSSVIDIACTKLQTIGARRSKKDFVDIYFLLQEYSLSELFEAMKQKYPQVDYSQTHILKSLVYFTDAESQPMPRMHKQVEWSQVKAGILQQVKQFGL